MSHWARAAKILAGLHDSGRPDRENIAERLVLASRDALPVTGVGLSWVTPHGPGATLAATDGPARLMEELQFSLGEGPGLDSSRSGFPVLQADLARTAATLWPTSRPVTSAAPPERTPRRLRDTWTRFVRVSKCRSFIGAPSR